MKPYKLGLKKVVKLKTILLYFIQAEDIFISSTLMCHTYSKVSDNVDTSIKIYVPGQP